MAAHKIYLRPNVQPQTVIFLLSPSNSYAQQQDLVVKNTLDSFLSK